ncbi:hypothetical protein RJ639_020139 [Escallonia herrerae]|uniref:Uncharacterized protein n=1 Tax=Escallonia herrerae TaxID=1293975 RepID=A0AA88V9F6_9ASTE|nr:hypothetical protein RJ639_020139 [Escallonia herrerae]
MVSGYRRSLSFPNPPASKLGKRAIHVRSTSLPCSRSHPLISQLKDQINYLKTTWSGTGNQAASSGWLCDGLKQLKAIHESLDDLLQLPQARESLRRHSGWIEKLLDDILGLVDVYGIFQSLVLTLRQDHLAAQVSVRRRDDSKAAAYAKALRKFAYEMDKLVSALGKCSAPVGFEPACDGDAELAEITRDVNEVTAMVSATLLCGISSSFTLQKSSWMGMRLSRKASLDHDKGVKEFQQVGALGRFWELRKKGDEEVKMVLQRMAEMEGCIGEIECGSEKVFRSLMNTRVSLLNVLTQ